MAKRYTVKHEVVVTNPNDANAYAFDESIDLAVLLSQRLQRNVRQGHVFHIHKAQVAVTPQNATGDFDLGGATASNLQWCPATKNSARAWRHAFTIWRKQKMLRINAAGPMVRYDDFEVAYDSASINSRTSSIYAEGMNDTSLESVCVFGTSTHGDDITLEDIYESAQIQPQPSRFPLTNSTVKASKFTQEFPTAQVTRLGASFSTISDPDGTGPDSGAIYLSEPTYISDSACLAGVLKWKGYVIAEDSATATADTMNISLTLTVSIGTPLVATNLGAKKKKPARRATKGRTSVGRRGLKRR